MNNLFLFFLINLSVSLYCNANDIYDSTITNDSIRYNEVSGVYEKKFLIGIMKLFPIKSDWGYLSEDVITPNISIAHSLNQNNSFLFEFGLFCHLWDFNENNNHPLRIFRFTFSLDWYFLGTSFNDILRPYIQFDFVSIPLGGIDCGISCDILFNKFFLLNISSRYRTYNIIFNDPTGFFLNFSVGFRIE